MVSCKNKMATLVVTTALGFSVGLAGCASTDGNSATGMVDDTEVTRRSQVRILHVTPSYWDTTEAGWQALCLGDSLFHDVSQDGLPYGGLL